MTKYVTVVAVFIALTPYFRGLFFPLEQLSFILIGLCLAMVWPRRSIARPSLTGWGLLLWACASWLSILGAVNRYPAVLGALGTLAVVLVYDAVSELVRRRQSILPGLVNIFALSAGGIASLGLGSYVGVLSFVPNSLLSGRLASTFQYPNTTGAFFALAAVLCLTSMTSSSRLAKALLSVNLTLILVAFVFTLSRGGFLVLPVILGLFLLLVPWERKGKVVGFIIAGGAPALLAAQRIPQAVQSKNVFLAALLILGACASSAVLSLVVDRFIGEARAHATWPKSRMLVAGVVVALAGIAVLVKGPLILQMVQHAAMQVLPANAAQRVADINLTTYNVWTRFMFMQTGARIALDHPIFGVGGGGYASLYNGYQDLHVVAKLAHSHPVQVWAETGTVGLIGYILVWGGSTVRAVRYIWKEPSVDRRVWMAGLLTAAWAIGLHSLIDFDMSFLSIQLWVFALLGMIDGLASTLEKRWEVKMPRVLSIGLTTALIAVAALAGPMLVGEWEASLGQKALDARDYTAAIGYYEQAVQYSRINATHYQQLALSYYKQGSSEENLVKARSAAEKAAANDPHAPEHHFFLLQLCLDQKDWLAATREATTLLELQPNYQGNYDIAAEAYAQGLVEIVKSGKADEAKDLAKSIAAWPESFKADNQGLKVTKPISLALGEAHFLLGHWKDAEKYIIDAEQNASWRPRIYWWLALTYDKSGNAKAYDQLVAKAPYLRLAHTSEDYQALKQLK